MSLSICVRKALENPRQEIYSLSRTAREARDELEADARDLHPDFATVVEVKPASRQIGFKNGSIIRYLGGDVDYLERMMRGTTPDYVDGISRLPYQMQEILRARGGAR